MFSNRKIKQIFTTLLQGSRSMGRPRNRCWDVIRYDLEENHGGGEGPFRIVMYNDNNNKKKKERKIVGIFP